MADIKKPGTSDALDMETLGSTDSSQTDAESSSDPKPPVPYQAGCRFTIRSHFPPGPTPVSNDSCVMIMTEEITEIKQLSLLERCVKYPPVGGSMGESVLDLQVKEPIQTGDGYQAQVFVVNICGQSTEPNIPVQSGLVAKVFDPLYFKGRERFMNPFKVMDILYSHENAAYKLLPDLQGQSIPQLYGSYSLSLPLPDNPEKYREVRLILIEHIKGVPMSRLRPSDFAKSQRQSILYSAVKIEGIIYRRDIRLEDFALRNILVNPATLHVTFIDFGNTDFEGDDCPEELVSDKQYALICWNPLPEQFAEWVDWEWGPWLGEVFNSW